MLPTLLLLLPVTVSTSFFTEELGIESLYPSGGVSSPPLSLVTFTFRHTLPSSLSTASYFPSHWRDFVGRSGVNAMVASVTRGTVPYGWSLFASVTSNPLSQPRGAYLYMNFSLEEKEKEKEKEESIPTSPPSNLTTSPATLAAAWDRASQWLARAAGTSFTGSGTVPHTTTTTSSWSDATPKRGVHRAWYTFPILASPPTAMIHVVPRASACSEALWGVVSATPCRSHAGLGAALVPSLIFQAPWYSIGWSLDRGVLVAKVSAVMSVGGVEREWGEGAGSNSSSSSASHTTALFAAVREALRIPQDWGGDVGGGVGRGAACPLSHKSSLAINGKRYPLEALAGFDGGGGGGKGGESEAGEGGEDNKMLVAGNDVNDRGGGGGTPPLRLLQACLETQRTVSTPSSFPLGSGTVLLSIHNRCSGSGGAPTPLSPSSTWILVENPLPWMFTAVEGSALAWVEKGEGGGASTNIPTPTLTPATGFTQGGECGENSSSSSGSSSANAGRVWCLGGLPFPPPSTTLHVVFAFAPQGAAGILHSEEGPPDPARGLEIPPGRVSLCTTTPTTAAAAATAFSAHGAAVGQEQQQQQERWWGAGGVVMVPTPDAAMPYNVVVLCSTVCAFGVGTLVNALARKRGGGGGEKKKQGVERWWWKRLWKEGHKHQD